MARTQSKEERLAQALSDYSQSMGFTDVPVYKPYVPMWRRGLRMLIMPAFILLQVAWVLFGGAAFISMCVMIAGFISSFILNPTAGDLFLRGLVGMLVCGALSMVAAALKEKLD